VDSPKYIAIICAAGGGARFNSVIPKQYLLINGKAVIKYTIDTFLKISELSQIIVVTAKDDQYIDQIKSTYIDNRLQIVKVGGPTRSDSIKNSLKELTCNDNDWVLVHDAARCCIQAESIKNLINQLNDDPVGGILAVPAVDTIKKSTDNKLIDTSLERSTIYLAQTPQMFRFNILSQALDKFNHEQITDDASAVEQLGLKVRLIKGEYSNIKVTYPRDLILAKAILEEDSN